MIFIELNVMVPDEIQIQRIETLNKKNLEWAASNGNRYPPYPQLMATAISQ